jgi:hypothetical protein
LAAVDGSITAAIVFEDEPVATDPPADVLPPRFDEAVAAPVVSLLVAPWPSSPWALACALPLTAAAIVALPVDPDADETPLFVILGRVARDDRD